MSILTDNTPSSYDEVLLRIADYVADEKITNDLAYQTAKLCLMDSMGCAMQALQYPACTRLLGPVVPGAELSSGARVPGTAYRLDPVQATFNLGAMVRWLDFNDTWLAQEWGHPSDNLAAILMVADYLEQSQNVSISLHDVLEAMIKAYEIQGVLALDNSFNRMGLDHVVLVKVATTAVVTKLLGGDKEAILRALSNAWVDGQSLRTYRHAPNTGSRKSWAAGDATARAVWIALMALRGEMGYPSALTAPRWGFEAVYEPPHPVRIKRDFSSFVMENILFKIAFPAEFHAQTAVEAGIQLHEQVLPYLQAIEKITIDTHLSALRIIDKTGPLHNPADRDHCLQYMLAVALIFGELTAEHYQDKIASDSRIDALREKMQVLENEQFSLDYLDPQKRSIANSVQIFFTDGHCTEKVTVEYPLGHRRRREEGIPLLKQKAEKNLSKQLPPAQVSSLLALFSAPSRLMTMSVGEFVEYFSPITPG